MKASIDFETRNTVSIKAGASKYAKTAEILCLSYSFDDSDVIKTWVPGQPEPTDLLDAIRGGCEVHAHNAVFEQAVWREICVKQFNWPEVQTWRCTMARALYCGLPSSLDNVSKAIGHEQVKDKKGREVMMKMTKPRKPRKKELATLKEGEVLWHDTPELRARLIPYCEQDVRTEKASAAKLLDISPREWSVYSFDNRVNARGVMIDRNLAKSCIKIWAKHVDTYNRELEEVTFGEVQTANQVEVILDLLLRLGVNIGKLDKKSVERTLKGELGPVARRVLEIRREVAKASISKYKRMLLCAEDDDRIRGMLQFHGAARTGRFAGRLVQIHNLFRGILKKEQIEAAIEAVMSLDLDRVRQFGPVGDVVASLIRNTFIAAPGKKFLIFDFSSVEARGLAWAARERWLIDAFIKGEDPYIHMAKDVYHVPYEEVNKDQRFFGKTLVLGAGYQLGAGGLQRQLDGAGVKADLGFCQTLIDAYRKKNPATKRFWYEVEDAAVSVVRKGGVRKAGPYAFHMKGDWLAARLPSGRDIHYYKPRLVPGKFDKEQVEFLGTNSAGKPIRETTYSGKLVENLTQALCRDLLVEAMSRLERRGYQVTFHVHDEVVCEVPEDFGSVEEMHSIMTEVPSWANGFPIGAAGFESKRYRKD